MDDKAQQAGEQRVRQYYVDVLLRLGLTRPAGMTKQVFEDMQAELCQRLAYMTQTGLQALAEEMATRGGGKDRDRFPLAMRALEVARQIEPPVEGASPLMRKVFAHDVGQAAIRDGWAPELMVWLRANRRWPSAYVAKGVMDGARDSIRRAEALRRMVADGADIAAGDAAWLTGRDRLFGRCVEAARLGQADSAGVEA